MECIDTHRFRGLLKEPLVVDPEGMFSIQYITA